MKRGAIGVIHVGDELHSAMVFKVLSNTRILVLDLKGDPLVEFSKSSATGQWINSGKPEEEVRTFVPASRNSQVVDEEWMLGSPV